MQSLKCDANPYDPDWTEYFEKRETRLMLQSAKGRNTIVRYLETPTAKMSLLWGTHYPEYSLAGIRKSGSR